MKLRENEPIPPVPSNSGLFKIVSIANLRWLPTVPKDIGPKMLIVGVGELKCQHIANR